MNSIVELGLALVDYVKAELRLAKVHAGRLALGLLLVAAAGLLFFLAVLLVLWSLYLAFAALVAPPVAALITGMITLLIAGLLLWLGKIQMRG